MSRATPLRPWYRELTGYHWFVLVVCTLGWLFDCLDQQLFNIARKPAVTALLKSEERVDTFASWANSVLLIGWATGGIFFGIMGDRVGRARTMVFTILSYSVFTGLSGLAVTVWDFMFYRFLTGLGVGGQFAVGVSLVAEVMPDRARPHALGLLQALSAVGNISAALIGMGFSVLEAQGYLPYGRWRWMFAVGILPALLSILVIVRLKEPERWKKAVAETGLRHKAGSLRELFGNRRWRHRAIVGMLLGSAGVIGLWGIGFFSIDLNQSVFQKVYQQQARQAGQAEDDRRLVQLALQSPAALDQVASRLAPHYLLSPDPSHQDPQTLLAAALQLRAEGKAVSAEAVLSRLDQAAEGRPAQSPQQRRRRAEYLAGQTPPSEPISEYIERIAARHRHISSQTGWWGSITSMLFNIGAFFGMYTFSWVTQRIGRRLAFALAFAGATLSTAIAFLFMDSPWDVYWMVPLMGFCQLALFGGYAIYFPELFPTRLRSTGTSLCYNIARYVAAAGTGLRALLIDVVFRDCVEPMRYAGAAMCVVFLLGLAVLPFAPETRDEPLPE
ncbi:MAG: MFS transporter [Thermoguttaceae bacterium]